MSDRPPQPPQDPSSANPTSPAAASPDPTAAATAPPDAVALVRRAQAEGDLEPVFARLDKALADGDLDLIAAVLDLLRPADRVEVFRHFALPQQQRLIAQLDDEAAADILDELGDEAAADIGAGIRVEILAPIVDRMTVDEAADLLGDLQADKAERTLAAMDSEVEEDVRALMAFADETAGGRMTLDFVTLRASWTVQQAIEHLRESRPDAETIYYLYVVDEQRQLVGIISLRRLVVAEAGTRVDAIMDRDVLSLSADEDQEQAARMMARYDLLALPVVDRRGRLAGVITHDDLVDVLQEEATEDMYLLVGLDEEERPLDPVSVAVRRRLPWLTLNLGMQLVLVSALKGFEATIEAVAALAVLYPLVTGQGGNIGAQTMTIVVRLLALGDVSRADQRRLLVKEATLGVIIGLVIGLLGAAIAYVVTGQPGLAAVVAAAMVVGMTLNLAAGGIIGVIVPLTLRRFGLDPAVASSVFVTTMTDTLGVVFFIGTFVVLDQWLLG